MTRLPRNRHALAARALALALTLLGAGLAGCGQKGPLYLPGESPQQVEPGLPADPADRAPAGEEEKEEQDAAGDR
jgi:predicted small lipoprotein YifL